MHQYAIVLAMLCYAMLGCCWGRLSVGRCREPTIVLVVFLFVVTVTGEKPPACTNTPLFLLIIALMLLLIRLFFGCCRYKTLAAGAGKLVKAVSGEERRERIKFHKQDQYARMKMGVQHNKFQFYFREQLLQ